MATDLSRLFSELNKAVQASSWERANDLCDAILKVVPEDHDANIARVVLLLKLNRYEAALSFMSKQKAVDLAELRFERAYSLYRTGRLKDAYEVLMSGENHSRRYQLLLAQVCYKLEQYSQAESTLRVLLDETDSSSSEYLELLTNYYAARSAAGLPLVTKDSEYALKSFELAYNISLTLLNHGDLLAAETMASQAEDLCRAAIVDENELNDELAPILVQLAFVKQLLGKNDEALTIYNRVIKSKASDIASLAIAGNNIVSIKQDRELFDSAKKLKVAASDAVFAKLTLRQRQTVDFNNALLHYFMNKTQLCRQAVQSLEKKYPTHPLPAIILAALLQKEKKSSAAAIAELQRVVSENASVPDAIWLCLAQLQAASATPDQALQTLTTLPLPLRTKPTVVAIVLRCYDHLNRINDAHAFLDSITESELTSNKILLATAAKFKLAHGRTQEAAKLYERLVKATPDDVEALSGLIKTYALFNPSQAQQYEAKLPSLPPIADVDALEQSFAQRNFRSKLTKAADEKTATEASQKTAKKKKRTRKPRLPKNYVPGAAIDPERWLPLRERSTYRKTRKQRDRDREMSKGASQGTAPSAAPASSSKAEEKKPATATPVQTPPPASSHNSGKQANKKKKKGGK